MESRSYGMKTNSWRHLSENCFGFCFMLYSQISSNYYVYVFYLIIKFNILEIFHYFCDRRIVYLILINKKLYLLDFKLKFTKLNSAIFKKKIQTISKTRVC